MLKYIIGLLVLLVLAATFLLITYNEKNKRKTEEKAEEILALPLDMEEALRSLVQGVWLSLETETELDIVGNEFSVADASGVWMKSAFSCESAGKKYPGRVLILPDKKEWKRSDGTKEKVLGAYLELDKISFLVQNADGEKNVIEYFKDE